MAHYTFRIRQGSHSSDVPVYSADDDAAWDEAAGACSDMIRDTIARLRDGPEWRLEVADESGAIRHLFSADRRDLRSVRAPQLATLIDMNVQCDLTIIVVRAFAERPRRALFRFVSGVRQPPLPDWLATSFKSASGSVSV